MKPTWQIKKSTLTCWQNFVDQQANNQVVRNRNKLNVKRHNIDLSRANIWWFFVNCQVTTQQKSGPNTPVSRFLESNSPALDYAACKKVDSIRKLLEDEMSSAGLRFAPKIAENLTKIHELLEAGEWKVLKQHLKTLERNTSKGKELKVIEYLQSKNHEQTKKYPGLGPKQSRNFIQAIGLSRYVVPLDSRVLKKLHEFGCEFVPSSTALSNETVYRFLEDGIQQIAASLKIYPCILDACIFSSFDEQLNN